MTDSQTEQSEETSIVHRQFDTDRDDPAMAVAEAVADLEGCEPTDLTTMYDHVDHVIDNLFSNPPSPEAQIQVEFSYEGYRITIDQSGDARFVRVG
ncbi:HalOD1 output domain-containing protein [Halosimplex amylolyticum]|uniref:HalOD1 output domain-containing protein n=1 Tax=Halosimplex amylolyticum TaxID=3396616 RepID=UPI003F54DF77